MTAITTARYTPAPDPTTGGWLACWGTAGLGRYVDLAVILLIVAYLAISLPGLARWPPLVNDEGREANLFWVASGADPTAERMNAHRGFPTWGNGGLQGATAAIIFRLAGLGVFQARLTSLLWGGLLLWLVYLVGRRYWSRSVGLGAAAMLAVSDPFLVSSHTLRPDVQVAAMILGALLLAERALTPSTWPTPRRALLFAFGAGLLLGLTMDTHPNSLAFFPLVGRVFPLRLGWRGFLRRHETWLFAGGIVAAALYYLAVRFLPDPASFLAALGYWVGVDKAPPAARSGGRGLLAMLANEVERYRDYFGEEPLELGLILLGLAGGIAMAARGSYPARLLLLGLVFAFGFFVVAVSMKSKYYMLLTYPYYLLLAARVFERVATAVSARVPLGSARSPARVDPASSGFGIPSPPSPCASHAGEGQGVKAPTRARGMETLSIVLPHALLATLVLFAMFVPLRAQDRAWENYILARRYRDGQDYAQLTAQLSQLAGPGAKVLAPPLYWLGMADHSYVDIYVYERLERQYGMSVAQFLEETKPDFVITDAKIATQSRIEKLLYNELDARAERQMIVRHKNFGDVAVYRLRW
ncbi:MAG: glycosyltransferase family 39 protein [Chloroflexi bacterium]|nr:glycosyltransferase family 39 protein [Chloroflexota bacterium]